MVEKSGTWYSYAGERLGQGRENARVYLKEHRDVYQKIDAAVRQKLGLVIEALPKPPVARDHQDRSEIGVTGVRAFGRLHAALSPGF